MKSEVLRNDLRQVTIGYLREFHKDAKQLKGKQVRIVIDDEI
jgi:hypothetical protein